MVAKQVFAADGPRVRAWQAERLPYNMFLRPSLTSLLQLEKSSQTPQKGGRVLALLAFILR